MKEFVHIFFTGAMEVNTLLRAECPRFIKGEKFFAPTCEVRRNANPAFFVSADDDIGDLDRPMHTLDPNQFDIGG